MARLKTTILTVALIVAFAAIARADGMGIARRSAIIHEIASGDRALAFRTMDQAYPFRVIARGGTIMALPRTPRKLEVSYEFDGKSDSLDDLMLRTGTQGFLVIKDGAIVYERYIGGANENSRFTSWSVAKSFTSTLVGLALADGEIDNLNSPITAYLPELKGSAYDGVPIKNILEMSSGVEFNENDNDRTSDIWKMWSATMADESESFADYAKSIHHRSETAGSKWVYRSIDTVVLGMLVKRVTGQPLATMLSQRIWRPLGMEQDATWLTDRSDGLEAADCCINATLRDYGRFGLMMLNRGKSADRQIVPARWIDEATNPQGSQVNYGRLWPTIYPNDQTGYGYQWWIPNSGSVHPYSSIGLCNQYIYVNPAYGLVIVKASASKSFFSVADIEEHFAAFDAIGRFLETAP